MKLPAKSLERLLMINFVFGSGRSYKKNMHIGQTNQMQTFLPLPDFAQSLLTLDQKRLGNQRREALTLARGGWRNHPASKMWRGYEYALCYYGLIACRLWVRLGFKDNTTQEFLKLLKEYPNTGFPPWVGNNNFHISHQSNLLRKNPDHYRRFFPNVPDDLSYIWPSI